MSEAAIRVALETQLGTISPALATAYENQAFTPPTDSSLAYQRVYLLMAAPDNPVRDAGYRLQGIFQVSLMYPPGAGTKDAVARALAIRTAFAKNSSFTSSGVTVTIHKTPEIGNGQPDGDRWSLPVKIPFFANMM